VFCESCGAKIGKDEKTCKSCGKEIVNDCNLIVSRPGKIMGCAVKLHITVEDTEFDLAAGGEQMVKLKEGVHTVKYNIWCRREHSVDVTIEKGKVCKVIFKYDALWGGFKVDKKSVL